MVDLTTRSIPSLVLTSAWTSLSGEPPGDNDRPVVMTFSASLSQALDYGFANALRPTRNENSSAVEVGRYLSSYLRGVFVNC